MLTVILHPLKTNVLFVHVSAYFSKMCTIGYRIWANSQHMLMQAAQLHLLEQTSSWQSEYLELHCEIILYFVV